jgi:hypothetical protein
MWQQRSVTTADQHTTRDSPRRGVVVLVFEGGRSGREIEDLTDINWGGGGTVNHHL